MLEGGGHGYVPMCASSRVSRRLWLPTVAYIAGVTLFLLTFPLDRSDLALDDHVGAYFWIGFWLAACNAVGALAVQRAWSSREPRLLVFASIWFVAIAVFGIWAYGIHIWDRFDAVAVLHTAWLWGTILACLWLAAWLMPRRGVEMRPQP